jgi:nucleotide-binding universal stress UspA family protein
MNSEQAEFMLAHALPPAARITRWRRNFTLPQRRELHRLGVTTDQTERLQRILPAIAYYAAQGPKLADVRAPLKQVRKDAHAAAQALRTLLEGRDEARQEGRMRILQAIEVLHPERCEVDSARVSFFALYDHREPEALRILEALQALEAVAKHAVARIPKSQTRPVAHPYPVGLIEAALMVPGAPAFRVSASPGTPFRDVVAACYAAASAANTDPLRAIRAYLSECNARSKK